MVYPVSISVEPPTVARNRLTVAFRPLLAIPHAILVGPIIGSERTWGAGLLAAAAYFLAIVNWCAIIFTGNPVAGIRDFALYYLRWRTRAVAYMAMFVDVYPPFGDAPYPASIEVADPPAERDRASIAFRVIFAIPHLIVVAFLLIAWFLTSIFAWFAILFTGTYPASVYPFGAGVMRWMLRVEAYLLLLVDEYPPFTLS